MKKIVSLLLICLFLGFCSLFRSKAPYPTGVIFPLEKDGEMAYEGEIVDFMEKGEGNLFLSTENGFVYCLDGVKREILWKFKASEPLVSPPYLGLENIYVYDRSNVIYCLDKKGKLVWEKKTNEKVTSGIAEFQRKILLGTEKGVLIALNADNGEKLWGFQAGDTIRSTPVFGKGMIIFGCDDHYLYFLSEKGELEDKFEAGDKIRAAPLVDNNSLYFGSDDHYFYCLGLKKRRIKWKIKTGGRVFTSPVADKKRVFFLCWNNVLYCLNKKNGTILWWGVIPSRSFYRLEVIGKKIVVSSFSSLLACFEIESGENAGTFDAGLEIKSNPLWLDPFLLINLYDYRKDKGKLVFLKKEVKAILEPSKEPPQKLGEEIEFKASSHGFYKPEYEFYIKKGEEKEVVQEKSEEDSWAWFPEEEGTYIIGIKVVDEKEMAEEEVHFFISEREGKEVKNLIFFFIYTINFLVCYM